MPTYTVRLQRTGTAVQLDGVIEAVRQATVAAQAGGRIRALHVKAGEHVRAGQLLALVDDRESTAGVQRSQAQLAQAEAQWREAQAQVQRVRSLQGQGFVSQSALDTAEMQLQSAQAVREQAQVGVRQAGLQQGYTRLVAPYDAWVLQTHAQAGDLAVMGSPIVTLYAPQPLRAVVQLPASRRGLAQHAQRVEVLVEDGAQARAIAPRSTQLVPAADPVAQTQEWRLELAPQDSAALVPGQQVQVRLGGGGDGGVQAMRIPQQALVRRGELSAVYVQTGQGYALRAVRTVGVPAGDMVEIASGLREGDVVALDPVKAAAQR
ncbi:MAG: efflux RND transporter periplasmic adaptor subunit [Rhodoferax sp.]